MRRAPVKHFILDLIPLKDALLGHAQDQMRQLVACGFYRSSSRADLWCDLFPDIIEGLPDGFQLRRIKRGAFDELAGFHGGG